MNKVGRRSSLTSDGTDYVIAECGTTGDYSSCSAGKATQPLYNNPVGVVASEQYYGCGLHIFGASDNQENVGISGSYVQGEGTGLNWVARSGPTSLMIIAEARSVLTITTTRTTAVR
jgi:hypothetical protein